jgi:hypothetical protein
MLPKFSNLLSLKNVGSPLLISVRNYPKFKGGPPAMKHDVYEYIKWVRPEKIPSIDPRKSGDLAAMPRYDDKRPLLHFESPLLSNANEWVKSKFALELNPRSAEKFLYRDELIKKVQRHEQDYGSMEAKCWSQNTITAINRH